MTRTDTTSLRSAMDAALQTAARDPVGAVDQAYRIVEAWPDQPAGRRLLSFLLRKAGRTEEADQTDLTSVALSARQPGVVAAREAWAAGRWEDAEVLIRDHLKRDPEDAGAAKLLADIALRFEATREAETFYKRSLLLAPGYHDARLALATLMVRAGRSDEALAAADEVLARDANHFDALSLRAGLLHRSRRMDEADEAFRALTTRHPDSAMAWLTYAHLLKTVGRIDDSIAAYRHAIDSDPANGLAWFGLANLKTVKLDQGDVAAMREALSAAVDDEHRIHLHFALGKALDDLAAYEAAFEQFSAGSAIRRKHAPYDPDVLSGEVRKVEQVFSPALMARRTGDPSHDPIFIVSLPRSGSTLVEQILASHPLVEGTEELYDMERIARLVGGRNDPGAFVDGIADVTAGRLAALGRDYIESTRRYRVTDRPKFTDKMPGNWRFVGLINKVLPNARIIDVRRHPLSCGLANFSQHFNWSVDFSYDLTDIGRFYRDYVREMAHFDRVAPGIVHRVFYENLVDDLETEVRRLLDYLELPFDRACLSFFENRRAVHTPSSEQVRRPINREGIERWRHYEPWLDPLKQALGPVLDCYPAVPAFQSGAI
jgi:tetratricopeptide (TPR) repeat protein